MNAKEILNKIKWNESDHEEYFVYYADRASEKLEELKFKEIKDFEGNFLVVEKQGKEANIPIHRIREVRKGKKLIWRRGV